jgi:hypothetical protein
MTRALGFFSERGVKVERVLTDNGACYRSRPFPRLQLPSSAHGARRRAPITAANNVPRKHT